MRKTGIEKTKTMTNIKIRQMFMIWYSMFIYKILFIHNKNLSSHCNLTAQIEPVQDKFICYVFIDHTFISYVFIIYLHFV